MGNKWSRRRSEEKGFTLIELIIVIVILGIVAGVAVPKFVGLSDNARLSAARGVGGNISSTISSLHCTYLTGGANYDADDVIANTTFSGGVTVTNNSDTLVFASGSKYYNWTYTSQNNFDAAFIVEDNSSDFP